MRPIPTIAKSGEIAPSRFRCAIAGASRRRVRSPEAPKMTRVPAAGSPPRSGARGGRRWRGSRPLRPVGEVAGELHDVLDREAVLPHHDLARRRGAVAVDADRAARRPRTSASRASRRPRSRAAPARAGGSTSSRYSRGCFVEELPARHRDDARRDALGLELLARRRPRAGARSPSPIRITPRLAARGLREDVGAARDVALRAGAVEHRQVLAAEHEAHRRPRGAPSPRARPRRSRWRRPGRRIARCGIARSDISVLDGWCVGPSSPRPIESCVQTKIVGRWLSAASRTDGRM